MYTVDTNDGKTEQFMDIEDAEAYASSKPIALVTDSNGVTLFGYINGERQEKETPHAYEFNNILMPNGSLKTGSLSDFVSGLTVSLVKTWTSREFSDREEVQDVIAKIRKNAHIEVDKGIDDAMGKI